MTKVISLFKDSDEVLASEALQKKNSLGEQYPVLSLNVSNQLHPDMQAPYNPQGPDRLRINSFCEKHGVNLPRTVFDALVYCEIVASLAFMARFLEATKDKKKPRIKPETLLQDKGFEQEVFDKLAQGDATAIARYFDIGHPTYAKYSESLALFRGPIRGWQV